MCICLLGLHSLVCVCVCSSLGLCSLVGQGHHGAYGALVSRQQGVALGQALGDVGGGALLSHLVLQPRVRSTEERGHMEDFVCVCMCFFYIVPVLTLMFSIQVYIDMWGPFQMNHDILSCKFTVHECFNIILTDVEVIQ